MRVFSHCDLDHFDGCVGCKADGKGDCSAVFVDVASRGKVTWEMDWDWRSWLFGFAGIGQGVAIIHIGPLCILRVKA